MKPLYVEHGKCKIIDKMTHEIDKRQGVGSRMSWRWPNSNGSISEVLPQEAQGNA